MLSRFGAPGEFLTDRGGDADLSQLARADLQEGNATGHEEPGHCATEAKGALQPGQIWGVGQTKGFLRTLRLRDGEEGDQEQASGPVLPARAAHCGAG